MATRKDSFVVISLGVAMALAFWLLLLGPHRRDLAALRTSARIIESQVLIGSAAIAGLSEIRGDIAKLSGVPIEFSKRVRTTADVGSFVKDVSRLAERLGLREARIIPLAPVTHGLITVLPIKISYESRFGASFNFVRDVERMPRTVRVTDLAVQRMGTGEPNARPPTVSQESGFPRCSTELTIHLYCESIEVESRT